MSIAGRHAIKEKKKRENKLKNKKERECHIYLLLSIFTGNAKFEVEIFWFYPRRASTMRCGREMDCAECFHSAVDLLVFPDSLSTILANFSAEAGYLVADERRGKEGVGVDVNLPIGCHVPDLHSDLVSMSNYHHL